MASCKKRVYRTMCEQPDGSRSGRYKKNRYESVPIDAPKTASGTKKASKPTKDTKKGAKPVRKPVIDYVDDYDRHLDLLDAQNIAIPENKLNRGRMQQDDLMIQKMYLQDAFAKRQASKRKKYTKPKDYDKEAFDIISKSIDRASKMDFDRVLDDAMAKTRADSSKYMIQVDSKGKAKRVMKPIVTYKVYYMKEPSDAMARFVRKKARSLEQLRSDILGSGTLGRSYKKSVWIYTEDGKWIGRMRATAKDVEWTANDQWTNVKRIDKFGNVVA